MSTDRMGGISIIDGGEEVTTEEEIGKGDGVGKSKLLSDRVCPESQSSARSVGRERREVHLGVTTFDGSVVEKEGQEDKVMVDIKEGELMMFNEWVCEWEKKIKGRRQRSRVSYSLLHKVNFVCFNSHLTI